jgi:DnaK suppressor protein
MKNQDIKELSKREKQNFRARLEKERDALIDRLRTHVGDAKDDTEQLADEMDLATRHQGQAMLLRLADKERKLLLEINHALGKFEDDTYGLCEGTGEPIGLRRLEARPWTRFSIAYKELLEKRQSAMREP